ncbi:unnamed protein product, partial [Rotaria magnacalcarata]
MDSSHKPLSQPLLLTEDPEIRRTRKVLLITIGVVLGLSVLGTITTIAANGILYFSKHPLLGPAIVQSPISLILFIFGCLVIYRYSPIGLRV